MILLTFLCALFCFGLTQAERPLECCVGVLCTGTVHGSSWCSANREENHITFLAEGTTGFRCFKGEQTCNDSKKTGTAEYCSTNHCDSKSPCQCDNIPSSYSPISTFGVPVSPCNVTCDTPVEAQPRARITRAYGQEFPVSLFNKCEVYRHDLCIRWNCPEGCQTWDQYILSWQFGPYSSSMNICTDMVDYCWDETFAALTTDLIVVISSNAGADTWVFPMTGIVSCDLADCVFCTEIFSTYSCLPLTLRRIVLAAVIITVVVLSALAYKWIVQALLLTVTLIYYVIWILWALVKAPYLLTQSRLVSNTTAKLKNLSGAVVDQLRPVRQDHDFYQTSRARAAGFSSVLCILLLMVSKSSGLSCSNSVVAPFTTSSCSVSGKVQTCYITYSAQVTIPNSNTAACLSLQSEQGDFYGLLKLNYWQATDTITTVRQYYTSFWDLKYASVHHCYGAGSCDSDTCVRVTDENDKDANGEINSPMIVDRPGITRCDRCCGSLANGCFLGTDGCVFHGYGINPKNEPLIVALPQFITRTFDLGYEYSGQNTLAANFTMTGSQVNNAEYTLTLISSMSNTVDLLGQLALVYNSTLQFLSLSSPPSAPTAGMIGDIQSTTATGLTNPTSNSFLYDASKVSFTIGSKKAEYKYLPPAVGQLTTRTALPYQAGGAVWRRFNDKLVGSVYAAGSLTITLSTNTPVAITRYLSVVCPTTPSDGIAIGCYSCGIAATVTINLYSTCSEGQATLSSPDITFVNPVISISTTPSDVSVHFFPTVPMILTEVTITGSGSTSHFTLSGTFTELIDLETGDTIDANQTEANDQNPSSSWLSSWAYHFKMGDMGIFEWLFTILLFIVATTVVIGGSILAIWVLRLILPLILKPKVKTV